MSDATPRHIEVDEDYPDPDALIEMTEDLRSLHGVELRRATEAYFQSFAKQCLYCTLERRSVDVRDEQKMVWGFHTGGWSGAEDFLAAMHNVPLVYAMLERMDSGGHYYYDFDVGINR